MTQPDWTGRNLSHGEGFRVTGTVTVPAARRPRAGRVPLRQSLPQPGRRPLTGTSGLPISANPQIREWLHNPAKVFPANIMALTKQREQF